MNSSVGDLAHGRQSLHARLTHLEAELRDLTTASSQDRVVIENPECHKKYRHPSIVVEI